VNSCSADEVAVNENTSSAGSALLKIDNNNIPENVVKIISYLSREGHTTITKIIELNSNSIVEIKFNDVEVGIWHLKIDALDNNQKIIYTGETDITFIEDMMVDITLTMVPVSSGTGSANVTLNWGSVSNVWTDYKMNPILTSDLSPTFPYGGVSQCHILKDGYTFKMWFNNSYSNGHGDVGYVESTDGIEWHKVVNYSVLSPGSIGRWDDYAAVPGSVIKENDYYKMYYNAWRDPSGPLQVGYAVSYDGKSWEKISQPVLKNISNEFIIVATDIVRVNNKYYLFYCYKENNFSNFKINVAISTDGVTWTRNQTSTIITPTENWEGQGLNHPTVIYENNTFKMIYSNDARTSFGLATSTDGINWQKSNKNPIFTFDKSSMQNCTNINYPFLRKFNNKYYLYYSSTINGKLVIALATCNTL